MAGQLYSHIFRKFAYGGIALLTVLVIGTLGYRIIGVGRYSLVDCFYMTFITITTIGFGEIIDLSGNPVGRIFTVFIAVSGIGIATYILSNITAFVVEGEMSEAFRRRRMEKLSKKMEKHFIICGADGVGLHIMRELYETKRPHVLVDSDRGKLEKVIETYPEEIFIEGDPTDNDTLSAAGISEAQGLFAATGDDNHNLVICLTAKQINPGIRVVASCYDPKNSEKMKKAGADAVVLPTSIGGLRMASEMVRSSVVSFLDTMLRDKEKGLRIEELTVPESLGEKSLNALQLGDYGRVLLLAIRTGRDWIYNPPSTHVMKGGDVLVFMTTPEERQRLEHLFMSKA